MFDVGNIRYNLLHNDATIRRVSYSELAIADLADGGNYGLQIRAASDYATFRIDFGKVLKRGTAITFDAYLDSTDNISLMYSYNGEWVQVRYLGKNSWADNAKWEAFLPADMDHIDMVIEFRGNPKQSEATLIIDNIKATEQDPTGDIATGYGFEDDRNELWFCGAGEEQDANIRRMSYTENSSIGTPASGGTYALKISHASHDYPTFRLNFGKTLSAGSTITFDVYVTYDGCTTTNAVTFEPATNSDTRTNGDLVLDNYGQAAYIPCGTWVQRTITLAKECDHMDLFYNVGRNNVSAVSSSVYIDNIKATVNPVGDILEGYGFEVAGNECYYTGTGETQDATIQRVSYADANVTAADNGGTYALKVSHTSHYYPTFQLNFGKTLTAGTTVTFNVYGWFDGCIANDGSKQSITVNLTDDTQISWAPLQVWTTASVTLSEDCEYLQFYYNIGRNGEGSGVSSYILIDNVKAVEPETEDADFTAGVTFEKLGHEDSFTATGGSSDATIERVSYANLSIEVPSDGDKYALKVSGNSTYPTFRINFGKTLAAGTTITFDAYAETDGSAIVLMYSNWAQLAYLPAGAWRDNLTWEQTLTEDCDHIDLMWETRGATSTASAIIIDNIKAVVPEMAFIDGVTFEEESHASFFTGVGGSNEWRDATFEVVSFDGDNALKLTCASSQWPTFRINFGRTLAAGTVITFDAYTRDTTQAVGGGNVCIFEQMTDNTVTVDDQFSYDAWDTQRVTLTSDASYLDLVCTLWRWGDSSWATVPSSADNIEVYLDNFYAVEPIGKA